MGWTVGGGLEWMFALQWTVKGEYFYYDLGAMSYSLSLIQLNGTQPTAPTTNQPQPLFGVNTTSTAAFKGNIARVGLNYKF
jgi:outer membrane immunogenic protein